MAKHKYTDLICIAAAVLALVLCLGLVFGESLGLRSAARSMGYESRLFDTAKVHTIDIRLDDWDTFLSTAQSEEYTLCDVVIDGETVSGVGIRGKGNTSLSSVSAMDSQRYSFKVEFDHYSNAVSYHGLDKLSLNNLIQDNTYMKDYLTYRMMGEFGAAAPLCSYVYLTVNGEDWGLYLAVEGVEDSFLQRNYGRDWGELYKPDSMNMGGGRGNGRDFDMDAFMQQQVWFQTSPSGCHSGSCLQPISLDSSGKWRTQPVLRRKSSPFDILIPLSRNFFHSSISRSGGRFSIDIVWHSLRVDECGSRPNLATNCIPRSTRRGSSANFSDTWRSIPLERSSRPRHGSSYSPVRGSR